MIVGGRKGIRPVKNGGWWRWALVSPDGLVPSQMVCVPASVNLPLHHKVQKFSSGTGSPGWSWKKGRETVVVWWWYVCIFNGLHLDYSLLMHPVQLLLLQTATQCVGVYV